MGSGSSTRGHLLVARVLPVTLSTLALLVFATTPIRAQADTTPTPTPTPTCGGLDLLGACLEVLPGVLAATPGPTLSAQPPVASTLAAPRGTGKTHTPTASPGHATSAPTAPASQTATPDASPAANQAGICVQTVLSLCLGDGSVLSVGGLGQLLPLPNQCLPLSLVCTCPDGASVGGACATPAPPTPAPTPRPTVQPTGKPTPEPTTPPGVVAVIFGGGGLGTTTIAADPGVVVPPPQSLGAVEAPVGTRTQTIPPIPGLQLGNPLVLWPLFVILDTLAVIALVWFGRRSWAASHRA